MRGMKRSMAALLAACLVIAQGAPLPVRAAGEAAGNAYDDMSDQVTARNLENAMESTDSGASGEDPEVLISFSPAQWARMADIRTHVWVQYEDVWLDMGESAQYTINEDGQLISDYDGTWIMIEDQPAAYTLTRQEYDTAGSYRLTGQVPCEINGRKAALMVEHSDEHPQGVVLGCLYADDADGVLAQPVDGDIIQLTCRVIRPDMTTYHAALGEPIRYSGQLRTACLHLLTMQKVADTERFLHLFGSSPDVPLFMEMTADGADDIPYEPAEMTSAESEDQKTSDLEDEEKESVIAIALDALERAQDQIEKTLAAEKQLENEENGSIELVSTGILYQYMLREINGTTVFSPICSMKTSQELSDASRIIRYTWEQVRGTLLKEEPEDNPEEEPATQAPGEAPQDETAAADDAEAGNPSIYIENGVLVTPYYTMEIPAEWEGLYAAQAYSLNDSQDESSGQEDSREEQAQDPFSSYGISFYDRQMYTGSQGSSGLLFTLALTDGKLARYDTMPSAYLGMIVDLHLREIHYLSVWYPQTNEADGSQDGQDQYAAMMSQTEAALASIRGYAVDSDSGDTDAGYTFYPNPLESGDYRDGTYHIQVISGEGELYGLLSRDAELSEGDVIALNRGAGIVSEAGMIYKPVPAQRSAQYFGEDMSDFLAGSPVPDYFLVQRRTTSGEEGYTFGYVKMIDDVPYVCSFEDGLPLSDYLACASFYADADTQILLCSQEELEIPGTPGTAQTAPEVFLGEGQSDAQAPGHAQMGMFGEVVVNDGRLESFRQIAR